jgi:Zn-dependent M28 family amino/carboxypeptidase
MRDLTDQEKLGRENVIARRVGTDKHARTLILGAHLDSVPGSPGADDDASGIAGLLEIARAFSGVRTRNTLELVAFALEEEGLWGSAAHARTAREQGRAIFSLEMIGYFRDEPQTNYPLEALNLLYPSRGDFIAVGQVSSLARAAREVGDARGGPLDVRSISAALRAGSRSPTTPATGRPASPP